MTLTIVINLASSEHRTYSLPPDKAVIAAYAQSRGDYNTWNYEAIYRKQLQDTGLCWSIGNLCAFKDGRKI